MSTRCVCENAGLGGPSTKPAPKHLSECAHSDLSLTTRRYTPRRIKRVPGSRKLIAEEIAETARPSR